MSLATRCTACGTMFRVVQDQLKVSEGWVRCGRCQEVFNALEGLFDLDRDAPYEAPAPAPVPVPETQAALEAQPVGASLSGRVPPEPALAVAGSVKVAPAERAEPPVTAEAAIESRLSSSAFATDSPSLDPGFASIAAATTTDAEEADSGDGFADARFNTSLLAADEAAADQAANDELAPPPEAETPLPSADGAGDAAMPPAPSFLNGAERSARWRRPGSRIAMKTALALLAVLALQVSLQFHDAIAARWPALYSPLALLCKAAGCSVVAPRALDAVSVDSSGLARTSDNSDAYRLSLVLRNRAEFAVLAPSVELSLTDANGQVLARRVFAASEFAAAPPSLAPLAETPMQLTLATGEHISGYTIEIFYP